MATRKGWPLCAPLYVLLLVASLLPAQSAAAAWCNEAGDALHKQQKWQAAVQAWRDCAVQHNATGPIAAWSYFRQFSVYYHDLKDKEAAAAACKAGWEAYNCPHLAWCAAYTESNLGRYQAAKAWADRAITTGCFLGSCQSLQQAYWDSNEAFRNDGIDWEGPFDVLHWAHKGAGDEQAATAAYRRQYQAKFARQAWNHDLQQFQTAKESVSIPRVPALQHPEQCGKRMLPQRPAPAGRYSPQLHVVTMATNLNRQDFQELVTSAKAHGIAITVLQPRFDIGYWGGRFGLRLQLVTNYANLIPDEDIVMFVDGYDVVISGNASSIIDGYYKATGGRDIALFAAETAVWPERWLIQDYPKEAPTRYKFLNAGTWMASAHAARCMMAAINLTFDDPGFLFTDDQFTFANAFLASLKTPHPIITLDYNASVFGSLYDNLQGGFSSFRPHDWQCVEGNGWTFKLTGSVPKIFHASGNQGQHWMQAALYPHSLQSAALGHPAPCDPAKAAALVAQQKLLQSGQAAAQAEHHSQQAEHSQQQAAQATATAPAAEGAKQERNQQHHTLVVRSAEHSLHNFGAVPFSHYSSDTLLQFLVVAVGMLVLCATLAIVRQRLQGHSRKQYLLPSTDDPCATVVYYKSL